MTNYEIIQKLSPEEVETLAASNVVRSNIMHELRVYEFFNSRVKATGSRMQARSDAADRFCTSEETIKRIVKRLS